MKWFALLTLMALAIDAHSQAIVPNRRLNFATVAAAAGCTAGTNQLIVSLLDSTNTTVNADTYSGNAFTPSSNSTIFVFISGSPTGTQTVTNTGSTQLVWREVLKTNYNTLGTPAGFHSVWMSQLPQGTAPFSMTMVCNQTSGTGRNMAVVEVSGADQTAAFGTNAMVQAVGGGADGVANPTNKFAAPGNNAMNFLLFSVADDVNSTADNTAVANSIWFELNEGAYNTPAHALAVYYGTNVPASITAATNTATSRDWSTIVVEVKAGTNCFASNVKKDTTVSITEGTTAVGDNVSEDAHKASKWTAGSTYDLRRVAVRLSRTGSPAFTLTAKIWSDVTDAPGVVLYTSSTTVASASLERQQGEANFEFAAGTTITSGTVYWLEMHVSAMGDASNFVNWFYTIDFVTNGTKRSADEVSWAAQVHRVGQFTTFSQ